MPTKKSKSKKYQKGGDDSAFPPVQSLEEYERVRNIVYEMVNSPPYTEETIGTLPKMVNEVIGYSKAIIPFLKNKNTVDNLKMMIRGIPRIVEDDVRNVEPYPNVERELMNLMDIIYDDLFESQGSSQAVSVPVVSAQQVVSSVSAPQPAAQTAQQKGCIVM